MYGPINIPIGILIKVLSFNRKKFIYEAREYETETFGLRGFKKKFVRIMEKMAVIFADRVICISSSTAEAYQKMYKIKKPFVIRNTQYFRTVKKKDFFRKKFWYKKKSNHLFISRSFV